MKTLAFSVVALCVLVGAFGACGGDDGPPGSEDGGVLEGCQFEDRFLPFQVGYQWTYRVTDLNSQTVVTKSQNLTAETDPDLGEVIIQTTTKSTGKTVSALRVEDNKVLRLRQQDFDMLGQLERTTLYDPGQVRLDENAERLVQGAEWDENYQVTVLDSQDVEQSSVARTEHWTVLSEDAECMAPIGTLRCLQVRRQRTLGGVSDKQFLYAKGSGKVREVNAEQIEELSACESDSN